MSLGAAPLPPARGPDRGPGVVVVGGGLAGLTVGFALARAGRDVEVLEAGPRAGGVVATDQVDGFVVERGPQSFFLRAGAPLAALLDDLGLRDHVVTAGAAARRRLVLWGGRLRPVPAGLPGLLGPLGLLRLLAEPLAPRRRAALEDALLRALERDAPTNPASGAVADEAGDPGGAPDDESVLAFARRRFGAPAAERLVAALATGVYAGDPARLSARSAFPALVDLEDRAGSVVLGALRAALAPGGAGARRRTATLAGGLGVLPAALARALGPRLRLGAAVARLHPPGPGRPRWLVEAADGTTRPAGAVVLACPAPAAARLVTPLDEGAGRALAAIPYAPVAAVALGHPASAFAAGPPRGFGFLAPRAPGGAQAGPRLLGCLFVSAVFPDHAPRDHALVRVMLGGRLDPGVLDLDDAALLALARRDVEPLLGVGPGPGAGAPPRLAHVVRWPAAIPQPEVGHRARVAAAEAALARFPGLLLTGSAYRGVALGDVAADALATAERLLRGA